jgi:site-specific recombinase XerD
MINDEEVLLPGAASPAPTPSSLPPDEKRRRLVELVVNSVPSRISQRVYRMGVEQFFDWWGASAAGEGFSRSLMQRYLISLEARALAPNTINLRLTAVRKLAEEAAAQELLLEAEVISEMRSVKNAKVSDTRAGHWLTRAQAEKLLSLPDPTTLKGKRDHALLALIVGAGLGREELVTLSREQIQQRDGRWCLVDLVGKGGRVRTVAIPDWTQQAVAAWLEAMPIKEGPVLGKVNKGGRFVGMGMSAPSIYAVVVKYAALLGVAFRPHDLRRTYRKLAHEDGARIEQIQCSYEHASLTSTGTV